MREGGDVTIEGGGAELPDGFPDAFPRHDEAPVDSASSISGTDGSDEICIMNVTKGDIEATITMAFEGAGTQMGIILVTK